MRWLLRDRDGSGAEYEQVLQIRLREGPQVDGWWGEWQDIPTVDERT